jgi:hypothetical protein
MIFSEGFAATLHVSPCRRQRIGIFSAQESYPVRFCQIVPVLSPNQQETPEKSETEANGEKR